MNKKQLNRLLLSLLGVLLIGFSIGISRIANLGTDPFTTFNLGLSGFFDIQFGTYMIISNGIGLVLVFLLSRHLIGIGTFFNILLVGYASDYVVKMITNEFGAEYSIGLRILFGVISLIVLAIGASMYIVADRGVAPYDALPLIIEQKSNGKISFRAARVISDILVITIGFLFGATVGVITIISGFCMGPMMHFFRKKFTHFLEEAENEKLTLQENN